MKTEPLATFLRKLANRLDDEGDPAGAERLRDLAYNTPRMARALDEMVEQSRISERMANSVAVEHLRMRRRP